MQLEPEQIAAIAQRVITAENMNFGASSDADGGRSQRNRDWARIAGIIHHGHPIYNPTPDPRWHLKDAGGGRPQSDDVLAFKDTRMIIDFIGNAGANNFTVRAGHWEGPIGPEQNIYAPPVPAGGGVSSGPVTPTPSEVWTTAHQAVWERLRSRNLLSPLVVAQQLNAIFTREVWGQKRAGAGRGISDNTIAMKLPNGRLYGVKINPYVHLWGLLDAAQVMEGENGAGAVDHLGGTSTPPPTEEPIIDPPPPPPTSAPVDLAPVLDAVKAVADNVATLRDDVIAAVRGQSYAINAVADLGRLGGKREIVGTIAPMAATPVAPEGE